MDFEVFEEGGDLVVRGRLRDERPWAEEGSEYGRVHDMTLELTVRRSDLTITAASAHMERFPHAECREIEPAFGALVGLSIARGYNRAVQERFGRSLGCTHLETLARAIGPVVVQAIPSSALRHHGQDGAGDALSDGVGWLADSCHVWASGGPGPTKLALGWRPGTGGYPARSVAELRLSRPESER